MNLMRLKCKFARLNFSPAAKKAAALKAEFRREDEELYRQGRGKEVLRQNAALLGIDSTKKGRLIGYNGVRFD